MSNMRCPFCQQELKCWDEPHNAIYSNWSCPNCRRFAYGNKLIWQELIHTRKALEIAVDALKDYEDRDSYDCNGNWCGCECSTAHEALEQITALEQKDEVIDAVNELKGAKNE